MSESEKKFATVIPTDIQVEERSISADFLVIASDYETGMEATIDLVDKTSADSWSIEQLKPDGTRGERRFYFSSDTWKAPWQPKGPKPNWTEGADPNEPIN